MKRKVVVLCTLPVVNAGIEAMLKASPRFQWVATVDSLALAKRYLNEKGASLLLADPSLAEMRTERDVHDLMERRVAVVALLSHYVEQTLLQTYDGILELDFSPRRLEDALMEAEAKADEPVKRTTPTYELSEREREVLIGVAQGKQNKEIADELCISVHTVMSHRKNIHAKTGIKSVAGLTVYALMNGWIEGIEN